jgi:hypothetical protein
MSDEPTVWQRNPDGSYSPAEPLGWQEEHGWLARFVFWVRGIEHCNDREGQGMKRFTMRQAMDDIHRTEDPND